jgi:hypothetical protein
MYVVVIRLLLAYDSSSPPSHHHPIFGKQKKGNADRSQMAKGVISRWMEGPYHM